MGNPRISDLYDVHPVTDFGRRLKTVLASLGWTQETLAELAGVTRQTISNSMRSVAPKPETVERYAAILKLEPHKLDPSYPRRKAEELKKVARRKRTAEVRAKSVSLDQ